MISHQLPAAILAKQVPLRTKPSIYPEPFASRMSGRAVRQLGDYFGLVNFGVNLVELAPGAISALRHAHGTQDEFVFALAGEPRLVTDEGEMVLKAGMCAGFRAGTGNAHMIANRTSDVCVFLVVGDRSSGDDIAYPDDDIVALAGPGGVRIFTYKDDTPY